MAIYKFKIWFEEDEDVQRVIEISSTAKFSDLHEIILKSIDFDNKHVASFFSSDDRWRKGQEITNEKGNKEALKMDAVKINSQVNDPHQKFMFLYDPEKEWTILIELTQIILKEEPKVSYPRTTITKGKSPKQYGILIKAGSTQNEDEFAHILDQVSELDSSDEDDLEAKENGEEIDGDDMNSENYEEDEG